MSTGSGGGGGLHNQGCADLDVVRIVANSTAFGGALGNTVSGGDCAVSLSVTGSDITYNDGDGIDNPSAMR